MESNYDKRMLDEGPYSDWLKARINSDRGHVSNVLCGRTVGEIFNPEKKIFLAHLSRTNNIPDLAKETVSRIAGISKYRIDCLDGLEDSRILKS
jgi:phosphoribosyl 1,2-cyclic phosphodiesterase